MKFLWITQKICGDNAKRYQASLSGTSAPGSYAETVFKNNFPSKLTK